MLPDQVINTVIALTTCIYIIVLIICQTENPYKTSVFCVSGIKSEGAGIKSEGDNFAKILAPLPKPEGSPGIKSEGDNLVVHIIFVSNCYRRFAWEPMLDGRRRRAQFKEPILKLGINRPVHLD